MVAFGRRDVDLRFAGRLGECDVVVSECRQARSNDARVVEQASDVRVTHGMTGRDRSASRQPRPILNRSSSQREHTLPVGTRQPVLGADDAPVRATEIAEQHRPTPATRTRRTSDARGPLSQLYTSLPPLFTDRFLPTPDSAPPRRAPADVSQRSTPGMHRPAARRPVDRGSRHRGVRAGRAWRMRRHRQARRTRRLRTGVAHLG